MCSGQMLLGNIVDLNHEQNKSHNIIFKPQQKLTCFVHETAPQPSHTEPDAATMGTQPIAVPHPAPTPTRPHSPPHYRLSRQRRSPRTQSQVQPRWDAKVTHLLEITTSCIIPVGDGHQFTHNALSKCSANRDLHYINALTPAMIGTPSTKILGRN
jgi:hypothetical protein